MIPEKLMNGFEPELLDLLEKNSSIIMLDKGDVILDQGAFVKYIPIVLSGRLKVSQLDEQGHELFLYFVEELESCVMTYSCSEGDLRSKIRAVADADSEVLLIAREKLETLMGFRTWRNFVMRSYRERFAELIDALNGVAFRQLDDRLVKYLSDRASGEKSITITHQQIAEDLNSSREVISRLLKQLEMQGKVALGRNRIELLANQ